MFNFSVTHIGEYTRPEKYRQTVNSIWITFYVRGVKFSNLYDQHGKLITREDPETKPYFGLRVPGMKTDFEMGPERLNWVIMLENITMTYSDLNSCIEIRSGNEQISLPLSVPVQDEQVDGWQMELKRMHDAFKNPTPKNLLRVNLGVMNIFRYMIDQHPDLIGESPEEKLKHFIDKDMTFSKSISDFSRKCGVSKDHLRILFHKRFNINPIDYRKQKRISCIMELIANSNLSVKEISIKAGFKYVSHFCMEFQKKYGITPKEGIRKFRYRQE